MSIKPILFNTDMVRAILDGRKTVTRRVITPQPEMALAYIMAGHNWGKWKYSVFDEEEYKKHQNKNLYWTPPYHAGDILYVRETWHKYTKRVGRGEGCHLAEFYGYMASVKNSEDADTPWKPSIHMPKEAARIWLKVTNVCVDRLKNITHKQAENEGVGDLFLDDISYGEERYNIPFNQEEGLSREQFAYLWDSTVNKAELDRHGWEANPWVWVIEFERCEKPQEVDQ
jgi:hypothetical protein